MGLLHVYIYLRRRRRARHVTDVVSRQRRYRSLSHFTVHSGNAIEILNATSHRRGAIVHTSRCRILALLCPPQYSHATDIDTCIKIMMKLSIRSEMATHKFQQALICFYIPIFCLFVYSSFVFTEKERKEGSIHYVWQPFETATCTTTKSIFLCFLFYKPLSLSSP